MRRPAADGKRITNEEEKSYAASSAIALAGPLPAVI